MKHLQSCLFLELIKVVNPARVTIAEHVLRVQLTVTTSFYFYHFKEISCLLVEQRRNQKQAAGVRNQSSNLVQKRLSHVPNATYYKLKIRSRYAIRI